MIQDLKRIQQKTSMRDRTPHLQSSTHGLQPAVSFYISQKPILYHVPRAVLESPYWVASCNEMEKPCINLPSIDADTGHILVQYLRTGTYQTLNDLRFCSVYRPRKFNSNRRAVQSYSAANMYRLHSLPTLAQREIENTARGISIGWLLDIVDECSPVDLDEHGWLAEWIELGVISTFPEKIPLFVLSEVKQQLISRNLTRLLSRCGRIIQRERSWHKW
jgi:hypothetical protein